MSNVLSVLMRMVGLVAALVGLSVLSFHDAETDVSMLAGMGLLAIGAWLVLRRPTAPSPPA